MFETFTEKLNQIDGIKLNFNETGLVIMNITIAFIMFGVALGIKSQDFKNLAKRPKPVITGVVSQFLLMPLMTFLIIIVAKLPVSISLGMLLVASCPGGNVSNFITSLAKGNVALSVSLTAIADISSIILTPLNFTFWATLYLETLPLQHPIEIPILLVFKTIFFLMGLPLFAGMLFARKYPKITSKIYTPIKRISIIVFFLFVIGALAANFDNFIKYVWFIIPIILIHNALAFFTGWTAGGIMRLTKKERKTITIETGIQNSGIALVLIFNDEIFPPGYGGVAFVAAWWGVWHIISGLILGSFWSEKAKLLKLSSKT